MPGPRRLLLLLPIVLFAACGGDNLTLPSEGEPAKIEVVSGDGQSGRVGETLAQALVVQVTDTKGRPVSGATVVFTTDGGAEASPDTVQTNSDGKASAQLLLGTEVGDAGGTVHVVTPDGQQPVETTFTATALPASANGLSAVSGDGQTAPAGQPLPDSLIVQVADAFGNPVEGASVAWAPVGGGTVSEATTTTGADGRTGVIRTLGPTAGAQSTEASSEGLAGSPVTFTATATAGSAAGVHAVSGDKQTGAVGTQLPLPLVAEVVDADGNPVEGTAITWTVTAGGGTVDPTTGTTDASGQVLTHWTLGSSPGSNSVQAVAAVGSVTFTATATTGSPSVLAMRTQPSASATVGVEFARQPVVQLRDAQGNDVAQSGVAVTAAVASGSGGLAGTATRNTDGNGRASFTDLRIISATGTHTLIFAASGYTSVSSAAIDVKKASTTTEITKDDPDPSIAGSTVTVEFTVTSNGGIPSGTVTVSASGSESCSGSVASGSCTITLTGTGNRTLTASYPGSDLFEASSGTEDHQVQPANQPPTAAADAYSVDEDQTLSVSAGDGVLKNDSDPEGSPLTANPVSGPAHAQSFTLNSDGSFSYTPAADFNGSDSFTYRANDGSANSNTATVTITVNPVNDAPSFTAGPGQSAGPFDGPQKGSPDPWATGISPGAANESGQALTFIVSNDNHSAFTDSGQPQVSSSGTLTYTPNPAALFGAIAHVTVTLTDDGGTANGGVDTSGSQTFTITIQ